MSTQPDTKEVTPVHSSRRGMSTDAKVALCAALLPSLLGGIALTGHAYVMSDHVAQLESAQKETTDKQTATDAEIQSVESTATVDRDRSDKREALIEQSLKDISDRLAVLQSSINDLPKK